MNGIGKTRGPTEMKPESYREQGIVESCKTCANCYFDAACGHYVCGIEFVGVFVPECQVDEDSGICDEWSNE